ncbi:MAG: hypothetical protein ACFFCW_18225 [Candidatus Hodarchaeota archaeon]
METKKSIKVSFVILLLMMILALVYGLMAAMKPEFFVARSFQLYTAQSWTDYLTASPIIANYMLILERMAGGMGFVVSLGGLIVLLAVFKKTEKWTWFYIAVVALLGWVTSLVANIAFKNPITITINIIGLVLVVIGLIISPKDFLGKRVNT